MFSFVLWQEYFHDVKDEVLQSTRRNRVLYGATFMNSPFNAYRLHAIITVWVFENNEIYRAMERTVCMVPLHDHENGIYILYRVIVNSQLNRDNLTRCFIRYFIPCCVLGSKENECWRHSP